MKLFYWRIFILCLQILFIPVLCQGQVVFGEYSEEELALEIVSFEPEAKIVALYEAGLSVPYFTDQITRVIVNGILTHHHYRYKILKDNVLNFGDIRIPFTHGGDLKLEGIFELEAQVSYLENGERAVKVLTDENIKLVELDNGMAEYRLIFPNAKEGSILEWRYVKADRVYYSLEGWVFQGSAPKLKSMFTLQVPNFLQYQIVVQGAQVRRAAQISPDRDLFIWELDSVRSFQTEPYILNPLDYLDRVEGFLSTDLTQANSIVYSTWEELGTQIQSMKAFESYFKKNSFKKINIKDDLTGATQLETAKNIYAFVSNQFELMQTVYPLPSQDFNSLLKSKKGNHLDINLLLLVVLQQYGINANLVMINQKGENRTNLIPSPYLDQFSSSLVRVVIEEKLFWLDGTVKNIPFGLISPNKLMPKGFMIDGANSSLIPISLAHTSGFDIEMELGKDSVNNLVYHNDAKIFGLSVQSLKEMQLNQEQEENEENSPYDVTFEDNFLEKEFVQSSFKLAIKESNDELLILTPFEQSIFFDNLFIEEKRKYAVEFEYGFSERINFRLDIPEGYELDEHPESKSISMGSNELEFTFQVTKNDGVLYFESKISVNQPEISVSKYKDLRRFAVGVSEQLNSPMVLKKVH